jgi:hypothetical protein
MQNVASVGLDEASVGVLRELSISGFCGECLLDGVVHSQVQNRIHHAGHALRRTGPDRYQKRRWTASERTTLRCLQIGNAAPNCLPGLIRKAHPTRVVRASDACWQDERIRDR